MQAKLSLKNAALGLCLLSGSVLADPPADGDFAPWGPFLLGKNFVQFNLPGSSFTDAAADSVVGPDGSLYVAGTVASSGGSRFGIAKFNPAGFLDFKNQSLETSVTATSVALSGDFLLVAGYKTISGTDRDFIVCRFSAVSGANFNFPAPVNAPCVKPLVSSGNLDQASDIAVQTDGKFVVGGTMSIGAGSFAAFARFNPNGGPDLSFGDFPNSNVSLIRNDAVFSRHTINGIAIANNGKIVGVGETVFQGGSQVAGLLVRLNSDGTQDDLGAQKERAFFIAQNGTTSMNDVVLVDDPNSADDAIVAVGIRDVGGGNVGGVIAKLRSNGSGLDTNFGASGGHTTISVAGNLVFNRVAVQPGMGFLIVGDRPGSDSLDIEVRRFTHKGFTDIDFGNSGNVTIDFGFPGETDEAAGISVHHDGVYFSGSSFIGNQDVDMVVGKLVLDRIFEDGFE